MAHQLPKQLLRMVDTLDEEQLHALYHVVAQRLQLAQKAHALAAMSQFHVLDRVSFVHNGKQYEGTVTRLNQKTISISTYSPARRSGRRRGRLDSRVGAPAPSPHVG
jgi:hypothetical protein